jgi:hypothetical protein
MEPEPLVQRKLTGQPTRQERVMHNSFPWTHHEMLLIVCIRMPILESWIKSCLVFLGPRSRGSEVVVETNLMSRRCGRSTKTQSNEFLLGWACAYQ